MKVVPRPQLFNDISHTLFQRTVKKRVRKQYKKIAKKLKNTIRDLVNLKQFLNRNKLEKAIYMKKGNTRAMSNGW